MQKCRFFFWGGVPYIYICIHCIHPESQPAFKKRWFLLDDDKPLLKKMVIRKNQAIKTGGWTSRVHKSYGEAPQFAWDKKKGNHQNYKLDHAFIGTPLKIDGWNMSSWRFGSDHFPFFS